MFPTSSISRLPDTPATERLATAIAEVAHQAPETVAIVTNAGSDFRREIDYGSIAKAIDTLELALHAARPVGIVVFASRVESLVVIAAACGRRRLPVALLTEDSRNLLDELQDWIVIDDSLSLPVAPAGSSRKLTTQAVSSGVAMPTSGTSGPPKLVTHSWDSLLAATRLSEQWHNLRWLLVYDAKRWAGIQVWLQALVTAGRLVVPASRDPDIVVKSLADERTSMLPATPTVLRRLLTSADPTLLRSAPITRITLGGEAADATLLDRLSTTFPNAKITQVYATTELGEVYRVHDGRPGFPGTWLGKPLPSGSRLSLQSDGELTVRQSGNTVEISTGDLVERRGERYEFTGRRSDVIMVGGAKVYPNRVEELIRTVPCIVDARVYGVPNPITGELVAAEIVLAHPLPKTHSQEAIRTLLLETCRAYLDPHSVPRIIRVVNHVSTTLTGKTTRKPGA